jgi:hypothetical protein
MKSDISKVHETFWQGEEEDDGCSCAVERITHPCDVIASINAMQRQGHEDNPKDQGKGILQILHRKFGEDRKDILLYELKPIPHGF